MVYSTGELIGTLVVITVGILIICLNLLVLVVFKKGQLSDTTHIMLSHLAMADSFIGFHNILRGLLLFSFGPDGSTLICQVSLPVVILASRMSSCILCFLSIHFFVLIKHIGSQCSGLTTSQANRLLTVSWILNILGVIVYGVLFDFHYFTHDCLPLPGGHNVILLSVSGGVYTGISIVNVVYSVKTLVRLRSLVKIANKNTSNIVQSNRNIVTCEQKRLDSFLKTIKLVGVKTAMLFLLVLPGTYTYLLSVYFPHTIDIKNGWIKSIGVTTTINSMCNIFLFANRWKQFQKLLFNILKCNSHSTILMDQ